MSPVTHLLVGARIRCGASRLTAWGTVHAFMVTCQKCMQG